MPARSARATPASWPGGAGEIVISRLVSQHPAPEALGSPDPRAQAFELHDLAVINEKVPFRTVGFDIPGEYRGICRFEHQFIQPDFGSKSCDHVGSPTRDVFGNALGLDHDHGSAGVQVGSR